MIDLGNISNILLRELVLDPSMQCRAAVQAEVVEEYAAKMKEGASFPPIRVVRVEGRLLVVDGWHRLAAAKRVANLDFSSSGGVDRAATIACEITDGTRRDALLAALQANSNHGLQRSRADMRRAVQVLLMDAEWCCLPSRELAAIAGVSHVYVQSVRKSYGVDKGILLDEARREEVDAEPSAAWKPLLASTYERADVEKIRTAADPLKLVAASPRYWGSTTTSAATLRRVELQTSDWPWADDHTPALRAARAARLDTAEAIAKALRSRDCPDTDGLYTALTDIRDIPKADRYALDALAKRNELRPAIAAAVAERRKVVEAKHAQAPESDPWAEANRIHSEKDPALQEELWKAASQRTRDHVYHHQLVPAFRDSAYRRAVAPHASECANPLCGGWIRPSSPEGDGGSCVRCRRDSAATLKAMDDTLGAAGALIAVPGYGVRVNGVVLDAPAVGVLRALYAAFQAPTSSWLREMPLELYQQLSAWVTAAPPAELCAELPPVPTWRRIELLEPTDAITVVKAFVDHKDLDEVLARELRLSVRVAAQRRLEELFAEAAAAGDAYCEACEGSGESNGGDLCVPCAGTGKAKNKPLCPECYGADRTETPLTDVDEQGHGLCPHHPGERLFLSPDERTELDERGDEDRETA